MMVKVAALVGDNVSNSQLEQLLQDMLGNVPEAKHHISKMFGQVTVTYPQDKVSFGELKQRLEACGCTRISDPREVLV